jgi:hypothetical protein
MSDVAGHVEFDCEGCGTRVLSFGLHAVPFHQLCAVCLFLCEHVPPGEMMELRRSMGLLNLERKPL